MTHGHFPKFLTLFTKNLDLWFVSISIACIDTNWSHEKGGPDEWKGRGCVLTLNSTALKPLSISSDERPWRGVNIIITPHVYLFVFRFRQSFVFVFYTPRLLRPLLRDPSKQTAPPIRRILFCTHKNDIRCALDPRGLSAIFFINHALATAPPART